MLPAVKNDVVPGEELHSPRSTHPFQSGSTLHLRIRSQCLLKPNTVPNHERQINKPIFYGAELDHLL